jgi:HAD superfamily hydrolase (TIGR01509 family)
MWKKRDKQRKFFRVVKMKYKCLIFDCDGILVDSETISNKVMIEMAASVGLTIDLQYAMENFSGVSITSTIEYIRNSAPAELPDDFEKEFRKRTFELFRTELNPVKGIAELLEKITVPCCVASSGPQEKIQLSLTTTNLIHQFENRIFSSYDIGSWKPLPGIFLHAAKEMGFDPGECAVIEDSIAGVKAARAGGFDVFGLANRGNGKELENLGATVFYDMAGLEVLLHGRPFQSQSQLPLNIKL